MMTRMSNVRVFDSTNEETRLGRRAIREWLVREVAVSIRSLPSQVDPEEPLASYGLDSIEVTTVAARLEEWVGRPVSPELLREHPTIEAIAVYIANGGQ